MADNIAVTPGTGATVATDDVGGFHYQRVKLVWGADGTVNDADVASGKPVPSQLRHSDGTVISDNTGIKISTSQLAPMATSQQPFSAGAQGVYLPTNHAAIPISGTVTLSGTSPISGTVSVSSGTVSVSSVSGTVTVGTHAVTNTALTNFGAGEYETVAAGVTSPQMLGPTGALGDYLAGVLVIPSSTSPSAITIKDGSNTAITVFAGGATSVSNLVPFFIPLGLVSTVGGWQLTTGASGASAIGIGNFT